MDDPRLPAFKKTVVELVVEAWQKEQRALPLARLGVLLNERKLPVSEVLSGTKLKAYIDSEITFLRVISHPTRALTLAAIPTSVKLEGDMSQYFKSVSSTIVDSKGRPRLNTVLWMAFTRPVAQGAVRTVDFEPVLRFQDVTSEAADASEKPKILHNQIIEVSGKPVADDRNRVTDAVIVWADSNNIPHQQLYVQTVQSHKEMGARRDSIFERILRTLSEDELKSIVMPLSVVKRLLESE